MNRDPMNKYRATFRKMNGEITKDTHNGLSAWAYRNILANKKSPTADAELAALEDWEWETRMRIREVAALERIAAALEAQRLNHVASLTVGELMDGVNLDSDPKTEELNAEGATRTSYIRLAIEDLGFGLEVRAYDDGPVEAYGDATAEWSFRSPEDVHALADAFRTKYAYMLDMVATTWAQLIADGTIPAREA